MDNWHTVYFSAKSNSIALYLDGTVIGTKAGAVNPLSMSYNQIGVSDANGRDYQPNAVGSSNGWYYFNGLIDDFYFYNTAMH
jgi:AICAR transformylase/IMP cyclohydrolase PurH